MKFPVSRLALVLLLISVVGISSGYSTQAVKANTETITGTVTDADGTIAGAHVRVRATENLTLTDGNGEFSINGLTPGEEIELTAWSDGYYVASVLVTPPASGVQLVLRRYHTTDRDTYNWVSPALGSSEKAC
jgi:hypothetical protein